MSTLYVRSYVSNVNYSDVLLDFVECYEVQDVICGNAGVAAWCDRWFIHKRERVPNSKAMSDCDACVAFVPDTGSADRIAAELQASLKPYAVFVCNRKGEIENVR